ncbi:MAG: DUF2975 domain-containing protein [Alphaproteobacteria bacterium]|nr:DUF2975 domain-containing protein [Alphaproteobacteria bacterium]
MKQIEKVSSYLLTILTILVIILPLYIILQWLFIDTGTMKHLMAEGILMNPINAPEGIVNLSTVNWTLFSKGAGFASHAIGSLPFFLSLFVLRSIFQNYQKGEIFNTINATHYKKLGWLCFLDALIAQPLADTLMILAVTFSNPPGHRYVAISYGTPNLEALFFGLILIVISWVMLEGSKLHDDQKFTI